MKKQKKTAKKTKPAPKVAKKTKAKPVEPKEIETMDRSALKVIASQLKDMGSDIKVLKSDTDEGLQKKVNEALQKLPPPEMLKKLESVAPDKLVSVLKRDCLGIFIDLSDVSCVRCIDNSACARDFIKNISGGFKGLDKAVATPAAEKKVAKAAITPVSRYEPKRLVFVRDVDNPNPKGDPYHDTLARILDQQPENLRQVREICEEDFEVDNDSDFMKFVTNLRDPKEGIIKLDVDLSDGDKAALRDAGYDI